MSRREPPREPANRTHLCCASCCWHPSSLSLFNRAVCAQDAACSFATLRGSAGEASDAPLHWMVVSGKPAPFILPRA